MAKQYSVKLVKSLAGRHDKHIATAHSLGLRRIGDKTVQPDSPQTLGKIHQIRYLVEWHEQDNTGQDNPGAGALKAAPAAKSIEREVAE